VQFSEFLNLIKSGNVDTETLDRFVTKFLGQVLISFQTLLLRDFTVIEILLQRLERFYSLDDSIPICVVFQLSFVLPVLL
jgi:hypothetical protein